jgi:pantoate--beta-alanine ligase
MRGISEKWRTKGRRIAFVPTMGFLHEGHLDLVRHARSLADRVVVSIFVNPKQFGPKEDLTTYPRDLDRDMGLLKPLGVDVVFHPEPDSMYPARFQTRVEVTGVTQGLCGAFRPDFFPGVTTVVLKLFHIIQPHAAVFGQKDYQQWVAIRRMVRDLDLDIDVVGRPTVREADGLAMSSRNTYLTADQRPAALSLSAALRLARERVGAGERDSAVILEAVRARIETHPEARIQYVVMVDPETMADAPRVDGPALLALAVFVGSTRLIDNTLLTA